MVKKMLRTSCCLCKAEKTTIKAKKNNQKSNLLKTILSVEAKLNIS